MTARGKLNDGTHVYLCADCAVHRGAERKQRRRSQNRRKVCFIVLVC